MSAGEPKRHRVTGAKGFHLNLWDYGGDGPPLLLIHCTGGLARMWDPVAELLRPRFHVFAHDSRGQGDSQEICDFDNFSWYLSGEDLLYIMDALRIGPQVRAVGHSAGAAHIAYAEQARPGTFKRPVLLDAIIGPREFFTGERPLASQARKRINVFESRDEARERYASKPPMSRWSPAVLEQYMEHAFRDRADGKVELKLPGDREAWLYEHGGASDVYETMGQFTFAPLLVTSEESNVWPLVALQKEGFPGAEMRMIEGASHFIPQEKPIEVAEMVLDWFA